MTYLKSLNGLLIGKCFLIQNLANQLKRYCLQEKGKPRNPEISLNNIPVVHSPYQKRLGLILDEKLNFKQHIDNAISKITEGIAVIKKFRYSLPRKSLITIYKAFLRPLIDYGDTIYEQPQNESFCEKLKSVQYKVALAITGAIKRSSREKISQVLGFESLKSRRWYKRLSCMFNKMNDKAPCYLKNIIPKCHQCTRLRNNCLPTFHCRTECFKNSFFPSNINDWFNLDSTIRNSESIAIFKKRLLSFIRPILSNVYNIFDPIGLKFLTRLCLGFSHLNEHRFRHNFQECINPLCSCSLETENTLHYLLRCHHFSQNRIENFDILSDNIKTDVLLYGDPRLDGESNKIILKATISYLKTSERFTGSIFD